MDLGRANLQGASKCCGCSAPLTTLLDTWSVTDAKEKVIPFYWLSFVSCKGLEAP